MKCFPKAGRETVKAPLPAFQKPNHHRKPHDSAAKVRPGGILEGIQYAEMSYSHAQANFVAFVTHKTAKVRLRRSLGTVLEYESQTGICCCLQTFTARRQESLQIRFDEGPLRPFSSLINSG